MFPLAFVFLICGFLAVSSDRRAWTRATLAVLVFFYDCGALSRFFVQGKRKNDVWRQRQDQLRRVCERRSEYVHWEGQPPGTGIPAHPQRKLADEPTVYEFAAPIGGSYPLWYDPSYWYEGIKPHFSLKGQLMALYRTTSSYLRIFSATGTLYARFRHALFSREEVWKLGRGMDGGRSLSGPRWLRHSGCLLSCMWSRALWEDSASCC